MRNIRRYITQRSITEECGDLLLINYSEMCNLRSYDITIRSFAYYEQSECFTFDTREYVKMHESYHVRRLLYIISEEYLVIYRDVGQKKIHIDARHGFLRVRFVDVNDPSTWT